MDMENDVVRSWKEYTPTRGRSSNPVESIELDSWVFGGLAPATMPPICCGSQDLTHNTQTTA